MTHLRVLQSIESSFVVEGIPKGDVILPIDLSYGVTAPFWFAVPKLSKGLLLQQTLLHFLRASYLKLQTFSLVFFLTIRVPKAFI